MEDVSREPRPEPPGDKSVETVILAEEQQMQRLVFWGHGEASVEGTLRSQGLITLGLQSSETWGGSSDSRGLVSL